MRAWTGCLLLLCAACGGGMSDGAMDTDLAPSAMGPTEAERAALAAGVESVDIEAGELPADLVELGAEAPWSAPPVGRDAAPSELLAAWSSAANRDWCAPLVPAAEMSGARARRADFDGGWAVEFDKRGLPGVTRNGRACTDCGRSAFGIAGTAMRTDDEEIMEAEELSLRDGSRVRFEPAIDEEDEEESGAGRVATIKIQGQDCVYQVWSFGGDEHLEQLVRELRFVHQGE